MRIFHINLDNDKSRHDLISKTIPDSQRWKATHYNELDDEDEIFNKMVSMPNIRQTNQHKAKCGCFLSHYHLLKHIVEKHYDKVLILEDDVEQVNPLPKNLPEGFTYLGGCFYHPKITKGPKRVPDVRMPGVHELDKSQDRI